VIWLTKNCFQEKYTTDSRSRAFVERYLHLSMEKVFDISNHLVSFGR
jgi:uncharacterized protein YutE (UPF0331/DUF86 family)